MQRLATVAIAAGLALTLAAPSIAQQYRMDPNAPLGFTADSGGGYDPASCTTKLQGRVELTRDRTRLRGQSVTAFHERRGGDCGDIERFEAKGDVFYVTPDQRVRSDTAVYDVTKELATFTGNVVAVQGDDVTTSEVLVVSLTSNKVDMTGRVRGVFTPKKSSGTTK